MIARREFLAHCRLRIRQPLTRATVDLDGQPTPSPSAEGDPGEDSPAEVRCMDHRALEKAKAQVLHRLTGERGELLG